MHFIEEKKHFQSIRSSKQIALVKSPQVCISTTKPVSRKLIGFSSCTEGGASNYANYFVIILSQALRSSLDKVSGSFFKVGMPSFPIWRVIYNVGCGLRVPNKDYSSRLVHDKLNEATLGCNKSQLFILSERMKSD